MRWQAMVAVVLVTAAVLAGCGDNASPAGQAGGDNRGGENRGEGRGQGQGDRGGQRSPAEWLQQMKDNARDAKVSMLTVIPRAAAVAGGQAVSARLEEATGGPVWSVDVLVDTGVLTVKIDAVTDSLISIAASRRGGNRGGRPGGQAGNRGGQGQGNRDRGY